jgi:hypothetical protein
MNCYKHSAYIQTFLYLSPTLRSTRVWPDCRKQRKDSGARKNLLNTRVRMARSYGFFAQCFLFAFIMYFSQLRLARDDIRTSGVHVRTLVAAVQVGMLAMILSMQAVLRFIVCVVKRDNLAFALLGRSSSRRSTCSRSPRSPRSQRSLRSERSAGFTAFDDDLEEFDPDVESTGRRQADLKDAGLELVVAPERVSADAEEGGARKQFLEDVGKHHNDVEQELMIEKHTSLAPSPPPSLLSGAHSGEDGLENAIVFESNTKLDFYCLYIHSVGAVMYQTFMSFDYTLFNTQWMFATRLLVGWTATSLSNVCLKSAQRQELASRVRGSMWVLFYASIALAIQVSALVVWSWPEETSTGVLVNLYMPSFLAGCFWTTFCSEMAFAGTRTSSGILFDSRRALPTFLLVTAVGALYISTARRSPVSAS